MAVLLTLAHRKESGHLRPGRQLAAAIRARRVVKDAGGRSAFLCAIDSPTERLPVTEQTRVEGGALEDIIR
jgi:hypothetical protein